MDLVTARRYREAILLTLVALMAIIANLPGNYLHAYGLERHYLLTPLGIIIIVALFLYQKVFVMLLCLLLAAGANLPEEWAKDLGINVMPLMIALAAMVVLSVINQLVKLMPSGLEARPRKKSPEGIKALFYAIDRNNLSYAQQVLNMGFDMNMPGEDGRTPLMRAAVAGQGPMVELLLRNGADGNVISQDNFTALELALKNGHEAVAEILKSARQQAVAQAAPVSEAANAAAGAPA